MKAVIDTNVLLVANFQHADVSLECVEECIRRLQKMQRDGITIIDDEYRILGEYQNKTNLKSPKGVGNIFLKNLLRNIGNSAKVEQVNLTELGANEFSEFPNLNLQMVFDPPDRKFVAVANVHPEKPPIWQAADCKWLDWWRALEVEGVRVEFLCADDVCGFYRNKFPDKPLPALPD